MNESKKRKPKYRPGHFCQAEGCDNPLLWEQTSQARKKIGRGRFCSRACTGRWRSDFFTGSKASGWKGGDKAVKSFCEICKKRLTRKQAYKGRTCSPACKSTKQRHKMPKRFCEICNIPLTHRQLSPSRNGRFCSRQCKSVWASRTLTEKKAPGWKGGGTTKKCEVCDILFFVNRYRMLNDMGRFCSRECRGIWHTANLVGKKSTNWMGGKSFEPYPHAFNEVFRRKIRARDNQTCAICKKTGRSVHHINYVKDDTIPENCITLCASCHGKTGGNRDYWQVALTELVQCRNRRASQAVD